MGRPNEDWVALAPLKGQNSSDNPLSLGPGWATATENVVIDPESSLASKRKGTTAFTVPADTYYLARHLPIGATEANAELWAFQLTAPLTIQRKIGAGAFGAVTVPATLTKVLRALSFNGKLFLAGLTTTNRLHVWDGAAIREVGLTAPTAPTVANTGAGAYQATPRWYRIDWLILSGATVVARSELSPPVTFTPSGAGAAARVTQPTVPASATHWRVWVAASDNPSTIETTVPRLLSGNLAVGTTFFDDNVLVNTWTGVFRDAVGTYLVPPSVTRLLTDGHRIIMAGQGGPSTTATGETQPKTNRVWYTPVLGTADQGDDERIPNTSDQKNFLDVGAPPHGDVVELDGPMDGQVFSFGKHQPWRLVPTGDLTTPYLTYPVMSAVGAGESQTFVQQATDIGETESGRPAIYFADDAGGLYRLTANETIQFVSHDIQDEIAALASRRLPGSVVWSFPEDKQTWWHIPLGSPAEVRIYVFHWALGATGPDQVVRGGWTTWTHAEPNRSFVAFALHNLTPGTATYLGESQVPYGIQHDGVNLGTCYVFGREAGTDGATNYAAFVTAAPILPTGAQAQFRVGNPVLIATPAEATNLRVSATRDFGEETRFAEVQISPNGNATRVVRTIEGLVQGDVTALEITVGDALATDKLWQVDALTVPVSRQEPR
jgi:hypothetical protein